VSLTRDGAKAGRNPSAHDAFRGPGEVQRIYLGLAKLHRDRAAGGNLAQKRVTDRKPGTAHARPGHDADRVTSFDKPPYDWHKERDVSATLEHRAQDASRFWHDGMNIRDCVRMPRTGPASGRSSVIVESWGEAAMRRRDLLKAAVGASNLAMPKLGRAERPNKLVFAPTNDLAILDPVVTFARPTRNHGYLVYDTLYGIDGDWRVRPQMVEGHRVADDGSTWTLTLR
jgi:hypothetical protein